MRTLCVLCLCLATLPALAGKKPPPKKKRSPPPAAAPAPPPAAEPPRSTDSPGPAPAPPTPETEPPAAAAPAPAPSPTPPVEPPPATAGEKDLEKLRSEYAELRDALFRSRARAATLGQAMLSTKLTVTVRWKAGRHYVVRRAQVRLDEAQLWDAGDRPVGEDPVKAADTAAAPGHHELALHLEVRAKDKGALGYVSDQSFALDLPEGKRTTVEITGDEDGDLPEYKPVIKLQVRSEK